MCTWLLGSVPHRYGGLSGSHTITAGDEVGACFQTVRSEFQTHKAELNLTARTDDVLAARLVVLHNLTTGGTGPDGGTLVYTLHLREVGHLAVLEKLDVVVDAIIVVTAVSAWSATFPRLQTLPAEFTDLTLICFADCAVHTKIGEIFSLHTGFTPGTLLGRTQKKSYLHISLDVSAKRITELICIFLK